MHRIKNATDQVFFMLSDDRFHPWGIIWTRIRNAVDYHRRCFPRNQHIYPETSDVRARLEFGIARTPTPFTEKGKGGTISV